MADQKLTELRVIHIAKLTDLFYLVTYDDDGNSISRAITAEDLFNSITTGTNRVISGQVFYTGSGFTFESYQLTYEVNGMIYYSHGDQVTCAAPDGTHPRLDVIFADAEGLDIKQGTPAATPAEPTLDNPTLEVKTNLVLVSVGASAPTEISLDEMYLENAQEVGGEWDTAESTSGVRIDLASTLNSITGTYSIRSSVAQSADYFELDHSTPITIADLNNVRMTFRSLGAWKSDYLHVQFYDSSTLVGATSITKNSFPTADTVTTHDVYLVAGAIVWVSGETQFDKVRFTWKNAKNTTGVVTNAGFVLDDIYVQHGGSPTDPTPSSVLASKVYVSVDNFSGNLSSSDTDVQTALETIDQMGGGVGDMLKATYDPTAVAGDAFDMDNMANASTAKTTPIAADNVILWDSVSSSFKKVTWANVESNLSVNADIQFSGSDETSDLAVGQVLAFRMPYALTLEEVRISVVTAPTGANLICDIKQNGTTILSTLVSIDATEKTSTTATTAAVISNSNLTDDSEITLHITQIGSTVAGAGLKCLLKGAAFPSENNGRLVPVEKTGTSIDFTERSNYNYTTPHSTGNITISTTNAVKDTVVAYFVNASSEPSISGATAKLTSGRFVASTLLIYWFTWFGSEYVLNIQKAE